MNNEKSTVRQKIGTFIEEIEKISSGEQKGGAKTKRLWFYRGDSQQNRPAIGRTAKLAASKGA
jgi:hypothetical protein